MVAPCTGAWIETEILPTFLALPSNVAPCTGAWIETSVGKEGVAVVMSHPARVRGLKHRKGFVFCRVKPVAPCTGAWIETEIENDVCQTSQSHPARVRGLKRG